MSKNQHQLMTLKNLIGADLFEDVSRIFAGDTIVFPKCPEHMEKTDRNNRIIKEYDSGHGASIAELMEHYDLSQSQIYKIIRRTP